MAIDTSSNQDPLAMDPMDSNRHTGKFAAGFVIIAALVIGVIYSVSQIKSLETEQSKSRREIVAQLEEEFSRRFAALEHSNAQQLDALKTELDSAAERMGKAGGEVRRARAMVAKLDREQKEQAESLKEEIARKADQQQLGALTQDVSSTRTDLDGTKKVVDTLKSDLGMARSELGTLIARNHSDIEVLRQLGERDYYEFTLSRNQPEHVGDISMILKRTNLKRLRCNLLVQADDLEVEKKDRTLNEPIFFYVHGSKRPYEVVVNKIESSKVVGYLSTPKGAVQVATRTEGTPQQ